MSVISEAKQAATGRFERLRRRFPLVDHVVRTVQHYGAVKGSMLAGAVTFFGFLSVFPLLAVAFFAVGYVARVYPDAQDQLVSAIEQILPGMVSSESPAPEGTISLATIESYAGAVGLVGVVGVLYSGLAWVSAMRDALLVVFSMPKAEQPNLMFGKLRDLITLGVVGVVLVFTVAVSGVVTGLSDRVLDWLDLGDGLGWILVTVSTLVALAANALLFFSLFHILARPEVPVRAQWAGALVGAVGFEALKLAASYLIAATQGQPAFQAFGISLILLVWINYFSRVVMLSASWALTSGTPAGAEGEESSALAPAGAAAAPSAPGRRVAATAARTGGGTEEAPSPRAAFGLGAAAGAAATLLAVRRKRRP